jgi:aminodeoxyfutalosine deaminase
VQFADFYEEARESGIPTTCHAGETVGTENLRAALDLRVRRIGHGTHLDSAPELMAEVVRRRLPLEIGLTSNVRTRSVPSMAAHPALSFHRAGVPITLNTDDRGIIGIDLTHEYLSALELGFSFEELRALSLGAVEHLFLPEKDRAALRKALDAQAAPSESHAE